jgi:uroporphyrinogen-III synthase
MSLRGVCVLVTRPPEQARAMVELIEQYGGTALCTPMIRILPPVDWRECDEQIGRLKEYAGVVFASANSAAKFLERASDRGKISELQAGPALYAVGKKTAGILERAGLATAFIPETFSGKELAVFFLGAKLAGARYLLPRGDHGREEIADALRAAGAEVVPVVVYRTIGPDEASATRVREALGARRIDVVTFASPSAVRHFVEILDPQLLEYVKSSVVVGAIGGTTADAAAQFGLPVQVVASTATGEGLVESLAAWKQNIIY